MMTNTTNRTIFLVTTSARNWSLVVGTEADIKGRIVMSWRAPLGTLGAEAHERRCDRLPAGFKTRTEALDFAIGLGLRV